MNLTNLNLGTISIYSTGSQICKPGHQWSHRFDDRYLFHFIVDGTGTFRCDGHEYYLKKGELFFIGEKTGTYEADKTTPWTYIWVEFYGSFMEECLAKLHLSPQTPIYTCTNFEQVKQSFEQVLNCFHLDNEVLACGCLFQLLGTLLEYDSKKITTPSKTVHAYVEKCCEFIYQNYHRDITTSDMEAFVGLEYSYLFRLFQQQLQTTPVKLLFDYRMKKAGVLLSSPEPSISELALQVGYRDRITFSKAFKRAYGMSPQAYRELAKAGLLNLPPEDI